jgi:hypothetical protein
MGVGKGRFSMQTTARLSAASPRCAVGFTLLSGTQWKWLFSITGFYQLLTTHLFD